MIPTNKEFATTLSPPQTIYDQCSEQEDNASYNATQEFDGAGTYTVTPDSSTCEHKSLWTGWTINETTEKLNKMIKEWGG
jgi:hypothetical protein